MSRPRCSAALLVVLFLSAIALAVPGTPAHAAVPYVAETPLAVVTGTQDAPCAFSYSSAVWEDDAAGDWDIVWLQGTTTTLALGASDQRHPVTTGSWVAYEDDYDATWDVYACVPFATSTESPSPHPSVTPVATGPGDQQDPAIEGATVVYEDNATGDWDVWADDLTTGASTRLSASTADQVDPAISGSHVVYADHRSGNWDIYLYDLSSHKTKRLTTNKADQTAPQVSGDVVVYQDERNGNSDIYAYMIKAGVEKRLTTNKADQTAPQVEGTGSHHIVVYQDARNGNADLYFYDLGFKREWRLTDDPADQTAPSVAKTRVLWCDSRGSDPDIYQGSIGYPTIDVNGPGSAPSYNSTVQFKGWLRTIDGVHVVKTGAGGTKSILTAANGAFGFSVPHVQRKFSVRVSYKGDASHLPAKPVTVTVKPKALLTRPKLAGVNATYGGFFVPFQYVCTGFLKPHHKAGARLVTLKFYTRSNSTDTWVLKKKATAKLTDYAGYSSYRLQVTLNTVLGYSKWKVQAVHSDADHAMTLSPFSNVVH